MATNPPILSIACVGEVMIELIATSDTHATIGVAGDTFNTAVYLSRLLSDTDINVSFVTALGNDAYSDRIVQAIRSHKLDTNLIERRPQKLPGLYSIETEDSGERHFSYWRSQSAARTLFTEPCEVGLNKLNSFDMVFFSGITFAILPPAVRASIIAWIDDYQSQGGLFVYDSNHRPNLWESPEIAREINTALWSRANISLPSLDDEQSLFGDPDEASLIARLTAGRVRRGALKRGDQGPRLLSGQFEEINHSDNVVVVDTTAAGDSFNAGFLASIALGQSDQEAARAGHQLATKVIGHPGAIIPE